MNAAIEDVLIAEKKVKADPADEDCQLLAGYRFSRMSARGRGAGGWSCSKRSRYLDAASRSGWTRQRADPVENARRVLC